MPDIDHNGETHNRLERSIESVELSLQNLKDNHLAHLAGDISDLKTTLSAYGKDLEWLKQFFWVVATASIGSLIAAIFNVIMNTK